MLITLFDLQLAKPHKHTQEGLALFIYLEYLLVTHIDLCVKKKRKEKRKLDLKETIQQQYPPPQNKGNKNVS